MCLWPKEIQSSEMVEFSSGVKGIALNLENEMAFWLFLICIVVCFILLLWLTWFEFTRGVLMDLLFHSFLGNSSLGQAFELRECRVYYTLNRKKNDSSHYR